MGRKKQTVGYRYYLGMHSVFCQGPVDKVTHIYWDDDLAWTGDWTGGRITINKPNLFGGDDKEGGIKGSFDLIRGHQLSKNSYLVSQQGSNNVSAFYGTTSIVSRQPYLGNSPYMKAMSAVIQAGEWQYPGKAQWSIPNMKIPWDSVTGPTEPEESPNDAAIREGLDVWIGYCGNTTTQDGNSVEDLANAIRTAINKRLNAIAAPSSAADKQIGLGIGWGGTYGFGGGERAAARGDALWYGQASDYVVGDTTSGAQWGKFTNYDTDKAVNPDSAWGTGYPSAMPPGSPGDVNYMMGALNFMGRDVSRRNTFKHGVLMAITGGGSASQFSNLGPRYTSSGGTFQVHLFRPEDFRRTKSPYDFIQSRVDAYVKNILENGYPGGSDSSTEPWDDDINLNSNSASKNRPSRKGYDVNPVHILREVITNPIIGLGEPENAVDSEWADYAADLLYDEKFGISIKWSQEEPVEDFMQTICDHANITTYVSNRTGLWVIKPIRGDYNEATIPVLDEDFDILEIESLTRRSPSEGVNAVTVKYHDIDRNDNTSIPVYNTAAIQMRDGVIDATTVFYDGILREDLAYLVGERDLLALGYPIVTGAIFVDRRSHYFEPGDVFRLNAPEFGVLNEVMRVVDVDYGNDEDHRIKIELSSDIYSLEPQPMDRGEPYVPPDTSQPPVPVNHRIVMETPYYLAAEELGIATVNASLSADPDAGGIYVAGPSPAGSLASAQVWSSLAEADDWWQFGTMEFAPSVVTDEALTRNPTDETINYTVGWVPSDILVGDVAALGYELVRVTSVDTENRVITVARGVFDTVPVDHPVGTALVVIEGYGGYVDDNYTADMEFDVKLLPFSGNDALEIEDAPLDTLALNSRMIRPYPAADLKVDGTYDYDLPEWEGTIVLTWVHRNRLQQQHEPQGYTEAGLTPEPGLTYTFRIAAREMDGTIIEVLHEEDLGLVDTVTVTLEDHVVPVETAEVTLEVIAVRDGYTNWTNAQVSFVVPYHLGFDLPTFWYDANIPTSMKQQLTKTGDVDEDMDPVRHIDNVSNTLPQSEIEPPLVPLAFKHWRLYVVDNNGDAAYTAVVGVHLRDIEGYNHAADAVDWDASTANTPLGEQACWRDWVSDSSGETGGVANYWTGGSSGQTDNIWCSIELATEQVIRSFTMTGVREDDRCPKNFRLEYSADGVTWEIAGEYGPEENWTIGGVDTRIFSVPEIFAEEP